VKILISERGFAVGSPWKGGKRGLKRGGSGKKGGKLRRATAARGQPLGKTITRVGVGSKDGTGFSRLKMVASRGGVQVSTFRHRIPEMESHVDLWAVEGVPFRTRGERSARVKSSRFASGLGDIWNLCGLGQEGGNRIGSSWVKN